VNPYLFVVGCPRSGTTLLQRMLDHHPLLAVSNDPHFIPYGINGAAEGVDPPVTPALVERLLGYRTFARLAIPEPEVREAASRARTYSELVGELYSTFARLRGKALAGEKTPRYVRFLPLLDSLFPWARTIHLVRDGRDVALSTLEWARADRGPGRFRLWRDEPIAVAALSWRWHVTTGRRDGSELGARRYREIRYEELVARTEPTLREVAAFLGLPFAHEMLGYHEGRVREAPELSAKDAWLPPTAGLRDWRVQMEPGDVELYEAIAGDLLELLGYERAFPRVSPPVRERAERCREAWIAEVAERRGTLASHLDLSIGRLPPIP
jgi:hypothetical protein